MYDPTVSSGLGFENTPYDNWGFFFYIGDNFFSFSYYFNRVGDSIKYMNIFLFFHFNGPNATNSFVLP